MGSLHVDDFEFGGFAFLWQVISPLRLDDFFWSSEELVEHEITAQIQLLEVNKFAVAKEKPLLAQRSRQALLRYQQHYAERPSLCTGAIYINRTKDGLIVDATSSRAYAKGCLGATLCDHGASLR
jgi:hypothetical protein